MTVDFLYDFCKKKCGSKFCVNVTIKSKLHFLFQPPRWNDIKLQFEGYKTVRLFLYVNLDIYLNLDDGFSICRYYN